jgi:hypothetical protein
MVSMETELEREKNKPKLFIFAALALLLIALLALLVVSIGFFDPKPLGQLVSREEFDQQIRIDDEYISLLTGEHSSSEYTVRLSAAWISGDQDAGYGLQLGAEGDGTIVAVSPLGYVTIMKPRDNKAPASSGLGFQDADHLLPWQTWPHVNKGDQANEIWIDIKDSQMTSVRINRELLWKGAAPLAGNGIYFWAESYGEPGAVTIVSYELFGAE